MINELDLSETINCQGCGALVKAMQGPTHKYIDSAPGCWDLYGQILAKEYGEFNYPELTHRLTVDTYAVQHPGEPGRQSTQSVNMHLLNLYLVLVKNYSGKEATQKMAEILSKEPQFEWLDPPVPNGRITVIDVLKAANLEEHEKLVREWAEDVWDCWFAKYGSAICKLVIDYL